MVQPQKLWAEIQDLMERISDLENGTEKTKKEVILYEEQFPFSSARHESSYLWRGNSGDAWHA
jgi:hypothetical protein